MNCRHFLKCDFNTHIASAYHNSVALGANILDVGAGAGEYSFYFARKGYSVSALELADANIAALLVYLLPFLLGIISNSLSTISWIIPLAAFIMENKSSFVTYHSANSLAFYVIEAILYIISSVLGITAVIASWISNIAIIGILAAGVTGILFLIIGLAFVAIELYLLIGKIISAIKAYDYQDTRFPIIDKITAFILNLKR